MGLPQLETACFVLDLKTGNIVFGCLNALFSLAMTVMMIVVAATLEPLVDDPSIAFDADLLAAENGLYVLSIILVIMFLVKFFFDLVFIYGVITERASFIKAYFIMWIVFTLLSMYTFFLNAHRYNAGTITMEVFYIILNIYAVLLSHSFYKLLNSREEV